MEKYRSVALALFKIKMSYLPPCNSKGKISQQWTKTVKELAELFQNDLKELREEFLKEHEVSPEEKKAIDLLNIKLKKKFKKVIFS